MTIFKSKIIYKWAAISLCAFLAVGCGDKSSSSGDDPTPPPPPPPVVTLPTTPVISQPSNGTQLQSNQVNLVWSWSASNGVQGSSWNVVDNGKAIYNSYNFDYSTATNQKASANLTLPTDTNTHSLVVNLCNSNGCSPSSAVNVTVTQVPAVPNKPVITAPQNNSTTTNPQVAVNWTSNTATALTNGYWQLITDGQTGAKITQFDSNVNGDQKGSTQVNLPVSATAHSLQVKLCSSDDQCSASDVVKITITDVPPPPPVVPNKPVIVAPQDNSSSTNPQVNVSWSSDTATALTNGYWQMITDGQTSANNTRFDSNVNGSQTGSVQINLSASATAHTLKVNLCSSDNQCTASDVVNITITSAPANKVVMGYFGNWSPYSSLRHGAGTDAASGQLIPYQVTGSMYQSNGAGNPIGPIDNVDFNAEVKNLDIMNYAFAEIYPDGDDFTVYPEQADLIGTVYFSDPWADLNQGEDAEAGGFCSQEFILMSSPSYSATRDLMCLQADRVQPQYDLRPANGSDITPHDNSIMSNWPWWFAMGNFTEFAKLNQKLNTKLKRIISIGGWFHDQGYEKGAFVNPQNFANSVVEIINFYQLDGVDLDYEPPAGYTAAHAADLVNLATVVRNTFNAQGWKKDLLITAAVYADPQKITVFDDGDNHNWQKFAAQLDYINVMGYDFHGFFDANQPTGFQSNLYLDPNDPVPNDFNSDQSVQMFITAGVPKEKLILGVPSYLRAVTNAPSTNNGLYQSFNYQTPFVGDMDDNRQGHEGNAQGQQSYYSTIMGSPTAKWDFTKYPVHDLKNSANMSYASWLYSNDGNGIFASYDTVDVINTKVQYVKDQGLAGMMMWEMISDVPPNANANSSLVCAMAKGLHSQGCSTSTSSSRK